MTELKPIPNKDFEEELEAKKKFWAYFEHLCALKETRENGQENIGKGQCPNDAD